MKNIKIVHEFGSLTEFAEYAEKAANESGSSHDAYDWKWSGARSFQEAVNWAKRGWSEERPSVLAVLDPVREQLMQIMDLHPELVYDMVGIEPDIDRFVSGELDCMLDEMYVPSPKAGKVLTVLVDGCVNSNVEADEILRRGCAIVALVEVLQTCGFELEIWSEISVGNWEKSGTVSMLTKLHRAGENIDLDQIMFGLAHPSMLRRLGFGAFEGEPNHIRQKFGFEPGGGYGRADGTVCSERVNASFVMSWGNASSAQAVDNPVAWVLGQLEAQGVYTPPEDGSLA
jgi:hypothetical protein